MVDIEQYRARESEQARINDLMILIPNGRSTVLDIGSRDGYIALKLLSKFEIVTALDLEKPAVEHERIFPIKGDVLDLQFPSDSFDTVLCTEVLEHIPPEFLKRAASEIARVAKYDVIIGVPYKQDIRHGRTKCQACGKRNPPWGHVNVFDEKKVVDLFKGLRHIKNSFIGEKNDRTNWLSTFLTDLGGNHGGTYDQEEPCVHCNSRLQAPVKRNLSQKVCGRMGAIITKIQRKFTRPHAKFLHAVFSKEKI